MAVAKKKSRRELAKNLLDISASVKEAATGLLEEVNGPALSTPSEVSERADRLRKKLFAEKSSATKGRAATTKQKSSITGTTGSGKVMISVCKMKRNTRGNFQKDGAYTEVPLERSYSYYDVIEEANKYLKLDGINFRLYRPRGGVLIMSKDLSLNGKDVPWTLGSYMRFRHVGPDVVQLGIGPAQEEYIVKQSFDLDVGYGKVMDNASVSLISVQQRDILIRKVSTGASNKIAFQPEDYGYSVIYIAEDGIPLYKVPDDMECLLADDCLYARGFNNGSCLSILYQSPEQILCSRGREEVSLYCVVNILSVQIHYNWHTPTNFDLPSTPVVYTTRPGVYFCTVSYNDDQVLSKPTEISVLPEITEGRTRHKTASTNSHQESISTNSSHEHNDNVRTNSALDHISITSNSSQENKEGSDKVEAGSNVSSGLIFPLSELLDATNQKDEANLLGRGGYGTVYKGTLRHTTVAIKFLNEEGCTSLGGQSRKLGADMLKTELAALTRFRHPHIVSIMGYSVCQEVVVYEYISGGSLYHWLHEVKGRIRLQWEERLRILKGTCCGLVYLHTADHPIVHQDIKSQNILVDGRSCAKITDFGFALELPGVLPDGRSMYTAQAFARSEGYYPGELTSGKYSDKSDVYSLGVVMLETYTGLKAFSLDRSDPKLVDHLEDDLKSLSAFKADQDQTIDECKEEWAEFLFNLITRSLCRHSKRPTSLQVMQAWEEKEF